MQHELLGVGVIGGRGLQSTQEGTVTKFGLHIYYLIYYKENKFKKKRDNICFKILNTLLCD